MSEIKACRSCGAPIFWAAGMNGKRNPINAQPDPNGNIKIINGSEAVYEGSALWAFAGDVPRYTSHFVTCPQSKEWRRKS